MVVVSLRWNGEPLVTRAARRGEAVTLGDAKDALAPLPEEALGCATIAIADAQGGPHVTVPAGKVASITGGDAKGAVAHGARGARLVAGPARVALSAGEEASLLLGPFEVVVAAHAGSDADAAAKGGRRVAAGAWAHTAMVAAIHAALLFAGSRAAMASSIEASGEAPVDALRGYLAAAEERSSADEKRVFDEHGSRDEMRANGQDGNGKRGGGERHAGEAGKAGAAASRAASRRWAETPKADPGVASPDADDLEAARTFGMVGVLRAADAVAARTPEGPSPWGASDPFAAAGGMLGHVIGEAAGTEGLSLSGIGQGGGGRGDGIGLGEIGTIGHTSGLPGSGTGGAGTKQRGLGFGTIWGGTWHEHWGSDRVVRAPRVWHGHGHGWSGRLPAEAIQRIVRQSFGRFRACYEKGLRSSPGLVGRVAVRFVIGRDGSVSHVADGGSDLPDRGVVGCVVRAFLSLQFPQPEGGIVTVSYPISFSTITDHR